MKAKIVPALRAVLCLLVAAHLLKAQQSSNTGQIAGVVRDPMGASVTRAKVTALNLETHRTSGAATNQQGRFVLDSLLAGRYDLTVSAAGFEIFVLRNLGVAAAQETLADVTLRIGPVYSDVRVDERSATAAYLATDLSAAQRMTARNTADLLLAAPGVSLRENGELATAPALNGMNDERVRILVNGAAVSNACANHMNPALSYVAPHDAARITVMAGITPVSQGGDSIGGTILINSPEPGFAAPGERLKGEWEPTGFYRSNGQFHGGSLAGWLGTPSLALGYRGAYLRGGDYTDGSGHKITSTYAETTDQAVTLAAQGAGNLVVAEASLHHTPYEGFVNAQMDLVRNYAESLNLRYRRSLGKGAVDGRVFWQNTWHAMNIGHDKSTFPMPMFMPMQTHGRDLGYGIDLDLPLSDRQILRLGSDLHRFRLDDAWPPVPGTAPYMAPESFVSLNNGRRNRMGNYVELASKWDGQWSTLVGLRNDMVWSNADAVQGYSAMYASDAAAFNAASRQRTDADFDLTLLARYQPRETQSYEFGYARKTRAPNLYERYAWSTNMMASGMIGWFGDGNYYVGNLALKPERANTVSGTASWRGAGARPWDLKLTPFVTFIGDFVDVDQMMIVPYGMSNFAQLQFANHDARTAGIDVSGGATLFSRGEGRLRLGGLGGWLHGERTESKTPLYQMMPAHARAALDEEVKGLTAGISAEAVDRKRHCDANRLEQETPGYALLGVHGGYRHGEFSAEAEGENLLNRLYELPLGGVNFDDFMATMWMGQIKPLTGPGRSFSFRLKARF